MEFDHIWNAPFSSCLPFLPPLSMKIIGYKTSVKSHSPPPSAPAWPQRSSSHDKTPLYFISGTLSVVDRGRAFPSPSHNSRVRRSRWPQPLPDDQVVSVTSRLSGFRSTLCLLSRCWHDVMKETSHPADLHKDTERCGYLSVTLWQQSRCLNKNVAGMKSVCELWSQMSPCRTEASFYYPWKWWLTFLISGCLKGMITKFLRGCPWCNRQEALKFLRDSHVDSDWFLIPSCSFKTSPSY